MKKNRNSLIFCISLVLLFFTAFISLMLGSSNISFMEIINSILGKNSLDVNNVILWNIRFPRIMLSMTIGMGLAVSGCVFQNILKNPLADPYTLGISAGASLGITIAIVSGLISISIIFLPLSAFLGTLLSILFVYLISARKKFSNQVMILAGVILGFLFSALVLLIYSLISAEKMQSAMFWLMGDLSSSENMLLPIVVFTVICGTVLLIIYSRDLDIITLGEEKALTLGINVWKMKAFLFLIASLITAACVAASGIIGFVGLIIPHFIRKILGPGHKTLILGSALSGAVFLTLCDTLARTVVSPAELPVGVITGLFGGVFFLIFLVHSNDKFY